MNLRQELRAPALDQSHVERLVTLCDQIVTRVVAGQRAADLIYAFNRETGRLFGPTTFRGVYGSEECLDFVERVLTTLPSPLPEISDAEAERMIEQILAGTVDDRESWYWVRLLAEHYDQPRFSDLVYWPGRELSAREIVDAAELDDESLDEYLDPMAWMDAREDRQPRESSTYLHLARRLLQEMAREQMLIVVDGEGAVDHVAPILSAELPADEEAVAVSQALMDPFRTSELSATDEEIVQLLAQIRSVD